jgi:hypothetical protein
MQKNQQQRRKAEEKPDLSGVKKYKNVIGPQNRSKFKLKHEQFYQRFLLVDNKNLTFTQKLMFSLLFAS